MTDPMNRTFIAFDDATRIATGALADVTCAAREVMDTDPEARILVFDAVTSEQTEIDLRGTVADVRARYAEQPQSPAPVKRSPGRPKLGVVAREVTLLPRHWEWLAAQPGGASVTLRKLVEAARKSDAGVADTRAAQESVYRFMVTLAGNEPGFEEATRALYAGDADRFAEHTQDWPVDVRDHARELASVAFGGAE